MISPLILRILRRNNDLLRHAMKTTPRARKHERR